MEKQEGTYQGITRELLYWYDEQGKRYLTPEETIVVTKQQLEEERQRSQRERQRNQRLEQLLREKGINIDEDF